MSYHEEPRIHDRTDRRPATRTGRRAGLPKQLLAAAKGVLTALRSHAGQRREYTRLFKEPANQHLAVARLRSPRATREWLARVTSSTVDG